MGGKVSFTKEQIANIEEDFKIFDKNNDQYLTYDELVNLMVSKASNLTLDLIKQDAEDFIKHADINKDQKLSLQEFLKYSKIRFDENMKIQAEMENLMKGK